MTNWRAAGPGSGRFGRVSLRVRISVLAALALGLGVALTSVAAFLTVQAHLRGQLDENLLDRARAAVASPLSDPARLVRVPAAALGAADVRIALLRADGTAVSARGERDAPPLSRTELLVARGSLRQTLRTAMVGDQSFRVVAVRAAPGFALVLAQSTEPTDRALSRLGLILAIVGAGGVGLAAYAGYGIARTGLRPVERLTGAAEHIARTEEPYPIAVTGDDELARLARSFNEMLAALVQSRERQRRLVADAGHELRTPLTSLRTNIELLGQDHREGLDRLSHEDRSALLAEVGAQTEELSELVSDLVELAREDASREIKENVELSEIVSRAVERVRRRSPGVRFDVSTAPWHITGDPRSLERAVSNLLDNAAKYSPDGGAVTVRLQDGVFSVADEGPGIAEADLPYVFDRFYRSAEARATPGSGLGLAIVRQAVERHGGTVAAGRNSNGGALLQVRIPGSSSPSLG